MNVYPTVLPVSMSVLSERSELSEKFDKPQPERCLGRSGITQARDSRARILQAESLTSASRGPTACPMFLGLLPETRYFIIGLCIMRSPLVW